MKITGLNSSHVSLYFSNISNCEISSGLILFCMLMLMSLNAFSQRITVSGYIQDVDTKEALIGANIFEARLQRGTSTNQYGFYTLTLPAADTLNVIFSFAGYKPEAKKNCLEG